MRGLPVHKAAFLIAISGIAVFGPAALAGANEPQTKPAATETNGGRAVEVRVAADADDVPPAPKEVIDGSDILRRLRERRAAELKERSGAGQAGPGGARVEAQGQAENPAPPGLREIVSQLHQRAVSMASRGKAEKVTFLGIGASPAPPVLTHQLHLPAGFGLVVDEVVPDGPADKAGLKQFDLIQKFDDQLLVDDRQLTALVHSHKPGETVALTVIRQGDPLTLKAKLAEHEEFPDSEGPYHLELPMAVPPEEPGDRPSLPRAPGPFGWVRPPMPVLPPLAPGAGPGAPDPRKPEPPEPPKPGDSRVAPPQPPAPPGPGRAGDDQARRLEQELQDLRKTADELRARVKAQQKQDADQQNDNQRNGGERP
jgi:hypothetical protein